MKALLASETIPLGEDARTVSLTWYVASAR